MDFLKRKLAFILALVIPFSCLAGCKSNDKDTKSESSLEEQVESKEELEKRLKDFIINMADIIPIYNLYDIYLTDEEVDFVMEALESTKECTNTLLDIEALYDSIILNSANEGSLIVKFDAEVAEDDRMIDEIVRASLKEVLTTLKQSGNISVEDACLLKELQIVYGSPNSDVAMVYVRGDNKLVIDFDAFSKPFEIIVDPDIRRKTLENAFTRWLMYGINMCRLEACKCRTEAGQMHENITYTNSLGVLESMAITSGNNDSLLKSNKQMFEKETNDNNKSASLLILLALFKPDRGIEALNSAIFNSDLQAIHDFFLIDTRSEVESFYKIAHSIDVLEEDNDYKNNYYAATSSDSEIDFRNHVGYAYKIDIFKSVLTDLMNYLYNTRDLSFEETMFLYRFVKSIIVDNSVYDELSNDTYSYTFDTEVNEEIVEVENIFFNFIGALYGISKDELRESYGNLTSVRLNNSDNVNVDYTKLISKFPLLEFIDESYRPSIVSLNNFDNEVLRK